MVGKPDIDGLERLVALRDSGALTQEEFDAQKKRLLADDLSRDTDYKPPIPASPNPVATGQGGSGVWTWVAIGILLIVLYQVFFPPAPQGYDRSKYVPCPSTNGSTSTSLCHR